VELVRAKDKVYALVADYEERGLHVVDLASMREVGVTPLAGRPGHVRALEGGLVAVSLRETGSVLVLEPGDDTLTKPFEERCSASVAAEPWALAETSGRLLVASGFGAALTVLGMRDLKVEREIRLPREPRAVLVANGGGSAFVSHAVGGIVSAVDLKDLDNKAETIRLHAGRRIGKDGGFDNAHPREGSQGYALASVIGLRKGGERDALRIYAPHTSVDPGAVEGGATSGYGGPGVRPVAPIVSVIDPIAKRSITNHVARAFQEPTAQECVLPRSAVADEKGVFVACMDIDAVLELDPWIGDPIVGERRRFVLPSGPSALALRADGKELFVWSELDRALSRVDRESGSIQSLSLWQRAGEARDAKIERGRRLFHTSRDARIAMGRACASCHPEGRDDGLVWTSPDGARNTMTLAGRLKGTAPYGWFGQHATVRDHITHTFERLGGTGFKAPQAEEELEALVAYLMALPAPPKSPPRDEKAADRGKGIFYIYCDGCHRDGDGIDGIAHDLGSGVSGERSSSFDTPSLRGVGQSAPYFHDGRYATLKDLLSAKDTRMSPNNLSEADKDALIAYMESL